MNDLNKSFTATNPFKRIINAFGYSMKGLKSAFTTEAAFRQNVLLFIINTICALCLADKYFCMWLLFCGLFILFAELINTAIEYIIDRISSEQHPLSGSAKDVGSALVFLALVNLTVSWLVYFIK